MTAVLRAGLVGRHIGPSRFPAALGLLARSAGIGLDFALIDTAADPSQDFETALARARAEGWRGLSVTHPYKMRAAAEASGDGPAARIGAANLLLLGDVVMAANTDYDGFLGAWGERMGAARPGRVAMAGAGGVAHSLGVALADLGASDIAIWDAEPDRAAALARRIGAPARAIGRAEAPAVVAGADGLVNATPLGTAAHPGSAFAEMDVRPRWAFDAVYTPVETAFLRGVAATGARIVTGFDLFRHMAVASFEAYTGLTLDRPAALGRLATLCPPSDPPREGRVPDTSTISGATS